MISRNPSETVFLMAFLIWIIIPCWIFKLIAEQKKLFDRITFLTILKKTGKNACSSDKTTA
jgi:uncharacterized membrane protein